MVSRFGNRQSGQALILIAFILGLAATAYLIKSFNILAIQQQQNINSSKILADAKSALIGYTFNNTGGGSRPGDMPLPDRLLTPTESPPAGGPPNYDGVTDSCVGTGANMHCLGRLPWQTIGLSINNPTQNDLLGQMPWYAISANLADPTCMSVLNPGILNMTYTTYVCGSNTNLPHPWITVRDSSGNVISNRVAIVLILPGKPLANQSRPLSPLADVTNYLDSITVPATCNSPCIPGTYSNADNDDDFIMVNNSVGASSNANDQLLFVTIDQLIVELVKRAAGEARLSVKSYYAKNAHFPYAAPLGATLGNNISSGTSATGSLPIDVTDTCTCSSATSCSCSFNPISNVAFKRVSGTAWTANSGACSYSGATCTCSGAGSCTRTTSLFTCDSTGSCTNNVTGANTYTYSVPAYANIYSVSANCSISSAKAVCTDSGTFTIGLNEPTWFRDNLWQDYFYYHQSSAFDLQVGSISGVGALIVGAGSTLAGQTRPPTNPTPVKDYLDSAENTNLDNKYDAVGTPLTNAYNDQIFIISP